jgi:hypothetical protein
MFPQRAWTRVVFLLVSSVIAIYVAEAAVGVFARVTATLHARPSGFDGRTKREVVMEMRTRGVDAFPAIQPSGLLEPGPKRALRSAITIDGVEVLPLGGIADKETVLCNETGQYVIYHSDEEGFHNPAGIWSKATLDVGAVGDSFTHGACVPSDKNAVALIRLRYPGTLNLGMSRNGPLLNLAALREYLPALRPRIVLWLHIEGHDFFDLAMERRSPLLMRYLRGDETQRLRGRREAIDRSLVSYVVERLDRPPDRRGSGRAALRLERPTLAVAPKAPLLGFLQLAEIRGLVRAVSEDTRFDKPSSDDWSLFSEILDKARDTVASWNGRFYVVYLPSAARYQALTFGLPDQAHGRVLSIAQELGIPVIDAAKAFTSQRDPQALFATPGIESRAAHYTEEGYRLLADTILDALPAAPASALP